MSPKDDGKDNGKERAEDRAWTLTDALAEAFTLGYETADKESFKSDEEALEDDDVADRLSRIQDKFTNEFMGVVEELLDVEEVAE